MLHDRIALEKHSTSQQELRDFKIRSIGFSRQTRKDLNQRPDFAQAKRECKRSHDEHQQDYRTIPRSQKVRQRKGQAFEGIKEHDYAVHPQKRLEVLQRVAGKPSDNFVRIAGQPANSFVIVVKLGLNAPEDEQLEFSAFFKP